jgi:putative endopeptidase
MDPAVNFAGVGFVIGHELTHAFDDQGSKFDLHGNARNWFTPEDKKQFDAKTDCLADQYSGFKVAEGQNLNGRLTLGENTADNGGLRIAFRALQETLARDPNALAGYSDGEKDGYTPAQRFFIASARFGARTRPKRTPGRTLRRTCTVRSNGGTMAWCRTLTNSARRLAAK